MRVGFSHNFPLSGIPLHSFQHHLELISGQGDTCHTEKQRAAAVARLGVKRHFVPTPCARIFQNKNGARVATDPTSLCTLLPVAAGMAGFASTEKLLSALLGLGDCR
jgi:hypothetical protein